LQSLTEALILARLVVAGAKPQAEAMLQRAVDGYTPATEFANRLVTETGMPFRNAHHLVGSLISSAVQNGQEPLDQLAARWREETNVHVALTGLDPAAVAEATNYGGGPGAASLESCVTNLRSQWRNFINQKRAQKQKWNEAAQTLNETTHQLSHP
jgi:argininosuccinate lyase